MYLTHWVILVIWSRTGYSMYIRLSGLAVPACSAILSFLDDKSVLLGVSLAICYKDNLILHIISFCNGYKFYSQLHLCEKKGGNPYMSQ